MSVCVFPSKTCLLSLTAAPVCLYDRALTTRSQILSLKINHCVVRVFFFSGEV